MSPIRTPSRSGFSAADLAPYLYYAVGDAVVRVLEVVSG